MFRAALASVFLLSAMAMGQEAATPADLPAAPSSLRTCSGDNTTRTPQIAASAPQLPVVLPSSTARTIDRKFILLQTFSTLALVSDLESTAHVVAGRQPQASEVDPLFGKHPTRARLYGIGVPLDAFVIYMSYHAKKVAPKRKLWEIGPALSIAIHSAATINNLAVASR